MNNMICCRCHKRPAVIFVSKIDGDKTTQEGFCLKCASELNIGPIKQMMEKMGITEDDLDAVSKQFSEMMNDMDGFQPGGAGTLPFLQNLMNHSDDGEEPDVALDEHAADTDEDDEEPDKKGSKKKKKSKRRFLSQFCTDLTQNARDGKIDAIIGRDTEIYRTIQILCRRTKNNPCLIGEPGVGKTAIAEGLALKIAAGDVPARLADKEIHLLDLTALVAGTQFRGQFESRIKGLVDEVKQEGNIILFIDEVHNLVGTGDAEGSMNAANILKPALSRGLIQVIGATTFTEYRKNIEKDAALERRFQPVKVEEPSIEECCKILIGIKQYYENFHKVTVSDALVRRAVVLSERYINDRFLPDKAIDLLDEACTCANLRNVAISDYEKLSQQIEEINEKEEELSNTTDEGGPDYLWTGIPTSKIIENDMKKLGGLEEKLKARIIGQDEAIEVLCAAIRRSRVQISPVRRPASFIFVGPTGVGKTELVKQLANQLFETPETLIRLDMSEFMEKFSVSRLIGSPPGYVGYDEAGQLTEKVRRKPYSVILFDEIEKAHPDVMNILLQILDEGKTNDAQGRTVSFENCVIVMTSNAGSNLNENALGFNRDKNEASKDKAMKALKEFLRPEFLGRVDEIVVFNTLTKENLIKITEVLLNELRGPLKEKGIAFTVDEAVYPLIADLSEDGGRGARDIRRNIRKLVEDEIANILIDSNEAVGEIRVEAVDGKVSVTGK